MANVLLDLDNTVTKVEPVLEKIANVFDKEHVDAKDLKSYNLSDIFGITPEQDKFFWEHYGFEVIEKSIPNSVMIESIYNNIIKPDDEVYIITARPKSQLEITQAWVNRFQLPHTEIILTGSHSKSGVIESLKIDTIIDDNPALFDEIMVVKDLFPKSFISQALNEKTMKRFVVDYGYNKESISEFRIDRETGVITDGIQSN